MKKIPSHFWYSPSQRNGILFLMLLIVLLQVAYSVVDFPSNNQTNSKRITQIRHQLDSLSRVATQKPKPTLYPFNPNFITDYKGYQLGLSVKEIDRLHAFRKQNQYVNTAKEFQTVTKVSDSLLATIAPYFKFPAWVNQPKKEKKQKKYYNPTQKKTHKISTTDLNLATSSDFQTIESVNETLANRIVKYRKKLQGFYFPDQLQEVWNINSKQVKELLKVFKIVSKPSIKKININTASFKEVLAIPYIDYDLCKKLFEYRDEVAELQSLSEIKNIKDFPSHKYSRIALYLLAE